MRRTPQEWLEKLKQARGKFKKRRQEAVQNHMTTKPIHPYSLCSAITEVLDKDATIIYDSFTGSNYLTGMIEARFAGQVLDAGPKVALGQGVGMCIGAQIARPGKQVMTLIGDGGMGISMGDIETMVRYNLPAIVVILNNSSWGGTSLSQDIFHPELGSWEIIPNMRYDKMFEHIGCHTEYVEEPEDLLPALDRSFNSGKPSVVNVISDATEIALPWAYIKFGDAYAKQGTGRLPERMAEYFKNQKPHVVKRMVKFWRDNSVEIPLEDVLSLTGMKEEDLT